MPITRMENYQAGDLTDILRAGSITPTAAANVRAYHSDHQVTHAADTWPFPSDHHAMKFSSLSSSSAMGEEDAKDNFGDPFSSYMRDPLLRELDLSNSSYFSSPNSSSEMNISGVDEGGTSTVFGGGVHVLGHGHHQGGVVGVGEPLKRPCNIFSRMLQISPSAKVPVSPCDSPLMAASVSSPRGMNKAVSGSVSAAMVASDMIINGNSSSAKGCLLENTGMQISSPRNPGIKRR